MTEHSLYVTYTSIKEKFKTFCVLGFSKILKDFFY